MGIIRHTIEQTKHAPETVKHFFDLSALGYLTSMLTYYIGLTAEMFDKIINPLLVGVGLILSAVWTFYRIEEMRFKKRNRVNTDEDN